MSRLDESKLVLADGTVLEDSSCGFADKTLWCWISGLTMADCFSIFSDPEKTNEITCLYYTSGHKYKGFVNIEVIKKGMDSLGGVTIDVKLTPDGDDFSIEELVVDQKTEEGDVVTDG